MRIETDDTSRTPHRKARSARHERLHRVWNPHQGLWNDHNYQLTRRLPVPIGASLRYAIVALDSLILLGRASLQLALAPKNRSALLPVIYVDCGTHRQARELQYAARYVRGHPLHLLGFEAHPTYFDDALHAVQHLGADLRCCALVGPDYSSTTIQLYLAGFDGRADSLFPQRGDTSVTVPATRLSSILRERNFDLSRSVIIIRMNIEGAERFVVEDLADAGLADLVDGWYGMWDDLAKIDPEQDHQFRAFLALRNIHPFPFNERDMHLAIRRLAIRLSIQASIASAAARKVSSR